MRLRFYLLVLFLCAVATAWACSLNPQPLPPETADGGVDASLGNEPDALGGAEAGNFDAGNPPGDDAGDAGDDASDASEPDGDAGGDDASDARDADALDGGGAPG